MDNMTRRFRQLDRVTRPSRCAQILDRVTKIVGAIKPTRRRSHAPVPRPRERRVRWPRARRAGRRGGTCGSPDADDHDGRQVAS